ncbi:hypothetical protein [Streptomyces arboris]|uniref:hypothetical protein n=1 Tax=Streptomyces arboris TaxID=2600619 RepID=UPI00384D3E9E
MGHAVIVLRQLQVTGTGLGYADARVPESAPGRPRFVDAPVDAFHVSDDAWITTTVDVAPWLPQKPAAILAHRSEVERGAVPGRIAALPPDVQRRVLGTEWYIREDPVPGARQRRR